VNLRRLRHLTDATKEQLVKNTTSQRVAMVTGGSGGVGEAVSRRLAADGLAVAVMYGANGARAERVVESITSSGGTALALPADVADPGDVTAAFNTLEDRFGGIDVVVHTAGIMVVSSVVSLLLEDLDRMLEVNVRGTFVVAQQAALRVRSGGAIVTFSSSVTRLRFPTYAGYAASKAAVEALTPILARELRGRDVTVNAVAPGPTATELFLEGKEESQIADLAQAPPLERLGTPCDIAEVVSFLAGPARWVNGQTLRVNGGLI
jgi:3-oxoacyl-[acyl-carrier protein] reductase